MEIDQLRLLNSFACEHYGEDRKVVGVVRHASSKGYALLLVRYPGWGLVKVLAHRFVVEQVIGRRLLSGECVHHRDRDKTNFNVDNLALLSITDHNRVHISEARKALKAKQHLHAA